MSNKKNKIIPIISLIISIVVFFFEFVYMGLIRHSVIALVASLSVLAVAICKIIYVSRLASSKRSKRHGYFYMGIILLVISILFTFTQLTKINLDQAKDPSFYVSIVIIIYIIINSIVAIVGLVEARRNKDYLKLGIKRVAISCSLMNTILVYRIVLIFFNIKLEYPYIAIVIIASIINLISLITIIEALYLIIKYRNDKKKEFNEFINRNHDNIKGEEIL